MGVVFEFLDKIMNIFPESFPKYVFFILIGGITFTLLAYWIHKKMEKRRNN